MLDRERMWNLLIATGREEGLRQVFVFVFVVVAGFVTF